MKISLTSLIMIYTIIILFLPMVAFEATSIYHSGSTFGIIYEWLNYDFSFLFLPIILVGFMIYFKHFDWRYIFLPIVVFIQDLIRFFFTDINILDLNSYEMYLSYLCGLFAAFICFYAFKEKQLKYFHIFWFINVCTQFLRFLGGLSDFESRFNVINLDVVGTGELSGLCLVLLIFYTDKWTWFEKLLIPVYGISILLSGTRNPLVFLVILFLIYFIRNWNNLQKTVKCTMFAIALIIIIICLYPFFNHDGRIFRTAYDILQFISVSQGGGLADINSVIGRFDSMATAINVLEDYPLGIGNGFIILQSYMQDYGYPTFPHSYFLCGWMLWGLWVWLVLGYGCYKLWKLHKQKSRFEYWGIYMLMSFFLSGNPIVNFKTWFCYIFMILIVSHERYIEKVVDYHSKIQDNMKKHNYKY